MKFSARAEAAFESWTRIVIRFRWLTIAGSLLFAFGLAAQIPNIRFENDPNKFLDPRDPAYIQNWNFKVEFGHDELLMIALQSDQVLELDFLTKLRDMHRDLEREVPHLDSVSSLINARFTEGREDELVVGELLEEWPETPADLVQVRERVRSNPLYRNLLISEDERTATIVIRLITSAQLVGAQEALQGFEVDAADDRVIGAEGSFTHAEFLESMQAVQTVVARYEAPDFPIRMAGSMLIGLRVNDAMKKDMGLFAGLSLLVIAGFLFALFGRLSGVILPVSVILLAVGSILGLMAITDTPLSVVTQILPSFVMIVGVCDSVHILTIVYQRLDAGDERREAVIHAMAHSGVAVLMTSITTAGGLMSFFAAEIIPVKALGLFAPIGVTLAFLFTVTSLPALLVVVPLRAFPGRQQRLSSGRLARMLVAIGNLGTGHPRKVVLACSVLLVLSLISALDVRRSFDPVAWFPQDDPYRMSVDHIDRELRGTNILEVVVKTDRENGVRDPAFLNRLEQYSDYFLSLESDEIYIGTAISLVDVTKEIHQALNEGLREYHAIPQDRRLLAQELLLFENSGSDDLKDVADSTFRTARLTLKVPQVDAVLYEDLIAQARSAAKTIIGDSAETHTTGAVALMAKSTGAIATTLIRSYVIAFVVITPLMMLLLGSVRRGLISMIPNLTPIIITLGAMGVFDFPFELTTLLMGSMLLSLAVDDTIHFMHRFGRYYEQSHDVSEAVRETLRTTGMALLITSLVLSAGFYIFTLAYMSTTVSLGILMGSAILVALLADVLLAPALVTLAARSWTVAAPRP